MNKYSKSELAKKAQELFKGRSEKKLYANERGEFFTSDNACKNSLKKGEASFTFERENGKVEETDGTKELTAERAELVARYKELFGKNPAKNASDETIQGKITEKEKELAEAAKKGE